MTYFSDRFIYIFLALLALFSWWLFEYTGLVESDKPKKAPNTPEYFSKGYTKWEMDEAGKLKSKLVAEEMSQFSGYWTTHTKKPVMEFIYENKPPWIIASETGVLSKDGKKLLLNGKVRVNRPKAQGFKEIIINTSNLKVAPETSYAETNAWAQLLSPPDVTTGVGLKAIFKEPIHLELLSKVKGRYETKK